MSEQDLIKTRQEKHFTLNEGQYPLPSQERYLTLDLVINHIPLAQLVASIDPKDLPSPINVRGRISLLRKSGGITFIKLTDGTGSIQLLASKSVLTNYDSIKLLDLGDIIEVSGQQCKSKTDEKSLLVNSWSLLTKAHRPPPEKFLGIQDQELKYRKRYVDLMSSEDSRNLFLVRSCIIRGIRKYMEIENFIEVETSTLNTINSGANAQPFVTHHNALDTDLYLRIAPELYLKRLLVGGFEKVYEIGRNYRNEGLSTRHNPEFTMMESYQAYGKFPALIVYTRTLLKYIDDYCTGNLKGSTLEYYLKNQSDRSFTFDNFVEVPMWDSVVKASAKMEIILGPNVQPTTQSLTEDQLAKPDLELHNLNNERLKKIDVKALFNALADCTNVGEKISTLFDYIVEPFLVEDYRSEDNKYSLPVFITDFPKDICPLARANDENSMFCDRFELFIEGRELCNAFQELNDPDEQLERFQEQLDSNNKDAMDLDMDYVEALQYGMPPAIGFGMGIDRLVMLLTNTQSIRDVILFPTLKPLK